MYFLPNIYINDHLDDEKIFLLNTNTFNDIFYCYFEILDTSNKWTKINNENISDKPIKIDQPIKINIHFKNIQANSVKVKISEKDSDVYPDKLMLKHNKYCWYFILPVHLIPNNGIDKFIFTVNSNTIFINGSNNEYEIETNIEYNSINDNFEYIQNIEYNSINDNFEIYKNITDANHFKLIEKNIEIAEEIKNHYFKNNQIYSKNTTFSYYTKYKYDDFDNIITDSYPKVINVDIIKENPKIYNLNNNLWDANDKDYILNNNFISNDDDDLVKYNFFDLTNIMTDNDFNNLKSIIKIYNCNKSQITSYLSNITYDSIKSILSNDNIEVED